MYSTCQKRSFCVNGSYESSESLEDISVSKVKVLVFQTDLYSRREISEIRPLLDSLPGLKKWTIDLDDCNHVLRVEGIGITNEMIINAIGKVGFTAEVLPSIPTEVPTIKKKQGEQEIVLEDILGYACPGKTLKQQGFS
jgi:hypothetical protein